MLRKLSVIALAALGLACAGELPVTESTSPKKVEWFDEGVNLISLLRGTTVIERSGEVSFEFASIFAIDGHPTTLWSSPPRNLEQWLVAELPVRTRIEAVGLDTGTFPSMSGLVKEIRFETSSDGVDWTPVGTVEFASTQGNQIHSVESRDARFVRVTTLANHGDPKLTLIPTLLLRGEELEEWERPSVEGRWRFNDLDAELRQDGTRVYGRIVMDPPMIIDGAWDGRVVRFAWLRGRSFGIGVLTANREATTLNGVWWYEHFVDAGNELGGPWYGTKVGPSDEFDIPMTAIAQVHVERAARFPLFGLLFDGDGALDVESSRAAIDFLRLAIDSFPQYRVRLEVAEYHSRDANQNLAMSHRRAESLREGLESLGLPLDRLVIVPAGSERPYPYKSGSLYWTLYSRVDFSFTAE